MEKSLSNQAARPTSEVRRNPDGLGVDRVDVQQVEAMPRDGEVPALTSLAGIWKDDPHFDLRALRSEWE